MFDIPYEAPSFTLIIDCLLAVRQQLRELAKQARIYFIHSWRERSPEQHQQMVALVCEAFALARQTIDALPADILKCASAQSSKMGTFYHTRGGMPPQEYKVYSSLMGASSDFRCRKGYAERNIERAKAALESFMGNDVVTWDQVKEHDKNLYLGWSTPLDKINHIGDEFYVLTLILKSAPEYMRQSHDMMLRKFREGNKKRG